MAGFWDWLGENAGKVGGGLTMGPLGILAGAGFDEGMKGTPDKPITKSEEQKTQTQNQSQVSYAPPSLQEQALQKQSLDQYMQMLGQIQGYEGQIGGAQSYQDQARGAGSNILGGGAFNLTPQEQMRIAAERQALISQGETDVNRFLDKRLQSVVSSAAGRGLRGQALGSLQGQVLEEGGRQIGDITRQADLIASRRAMELPQQRIQQQQGLISQGMSLADALRMNAVQNRQLAQNPALLAMLNRDRLAAPSTSSMTNSSTIGSQTQIIPGEEGGWMNALRGGLAGWKAGADAIGSGVSLVSGLGGLQAGKTPAKTSTGGAIAGGAQWGVPNVGGSGPGSYDPSIPFYLRG